MDGTTEPIIAVIGHPIAGNPTQFAIERAFYALDLEWRVLSFDVELDQVATAFEGFNVTGIAGVIIDPSVISAASAWYRSKSDASHTNDELIDCLFREGTSLRGTHEQQAWIDGMIANHCAAKGGDAKKLWIGDSPDSLPISHAGFSERPEPMPPNPDSIAAASVIVIGYHTDAAAQLEVDDWPADDGSTLVIDLTEGHPDLPAIANLGFNVVSPHQRQVSTIGRCVERWTGRQPPSSVISDAIEEYLGV